MKLGYLSTLLFIICFSSTVFSQEGFHFKVGMNVGMSRSFTDLDLEETGLHDLYNFVEESYKARNEEYSWDQFTSDYQIRTAFFQPRFGFSASVTFRDWPLMLIGEAMSSPSAYTRMSYGGTIALGKNFDIGRSDYFVTAYGGYKYVLDLGFGSNTLVNCIGNDNARSSAEKFFNPEKPLGQQVGNLFALRLGLGKTFGTDDNISAGLEAFGELDLTEKTVRPARMSNAGITAYFRFGFDLQKKERLFPTPGGGTKKPY